MNQNKNESNDDYGRVVYQRIKGTEGENEEKSHDEVLIEAGGFNWLAFRACIILISAKVSGDFIVNLLAFYQLMPKF